MEKITRPTLNEKDVLNASEFTITGYRLNGCFEMSYIYISCEDKVCRRDGKLRKLGGKFGKLGEE
jgi:hypothetical protein